MIIKYINFNWKKYYYKFTEKIRKILSTIKLNNIEKKI